jgi:hypothetical protein
MNGLGLAQANHYIRAFGNSQKAFMRSENRALLRSVLFDVPRRSSLGWFCYYDRAPALLRALTELITPEEIGRRMRRLCSRPYYLQLSILMCSYFGARQQLLLDLGLEPGQAYGAEKHEDACFVVDFWRRVCRACRADGRELPDPERGTQPILPAGDVATLDAQLAPFDHASHKRLRRLAATLELYEFILHGEQRDGLFAHGPYPVGADGQLVVHEFTDLQNDYLPWAETRSRNPYPRLAIVRRTKGLGARFDLFGGVLWDRPDITPCIAAEGLFTRSDEGAIVPLPLAEAERIEAAAAAGQNELFLKAAEWSPRYKAEYGVHLFANHLYPLFALSGSAIDWKARIRSEFEAAAAEVLDDMLARAEAPSVWQFMASTEGEFFWPLCGPQDEAMEDRRKQQ